MTKYRKLAVADLFVDRRYQRDLDEDRVEKMAENYDDSMLGVLEVSQRESRNGASPTFAVFDGQHRLLMAQLLEMKEVPCLVHTGMSTQDEANMFVRLQKERRAITRYQQFRAQLHAGDAETVAIDRVVRDCGWAIDNSQTGYSIKAVAAVVSVWRRFGGEPTLRKTLELAEPWTADGTPVPGVLLSGLGQFVAEHQGNYDEPSFAKKLSLTPPENIQRRAAGMMRSFGGGGDRGTYVARELVRLYNTGRRTKRLKVGLPDDE